MLATEVLKEEHRVIEKVLNAFDTFALKLERCEEMKVDILEKSIDLIRTFEDRCHHGKMFLS